MSYLSGTIQEPGRRAGRPRLYPQLKRRMLAFVQSSDLKPGDAIESEKALCRRFEVSRPLIRRALGELGDQGLIVSIPGKGHFRADPEQTSVESGAIVCLSGSTLPRSRGLDLHIANILEGLDQSIYGSPFRLLWENTGPRHRDVSEMVKPHLSDLRGVVLAPLSTQSVESMLQAVPASVKCVVAGRPTPNAPCVYVNHYDGMLRAMRYLLGLGHRRIGFVQQDVASWPTQQRYMAYQDALRDAGLSEDPSLVINTSPEPDHVQQATAAFLDRRASMTALMVASGSPLPWVLRAIAAKGVRIPHDLSLMAFDDVPISRQHLPAITVIREPTRQMGLVAGQMLVQLLKGESLSISDVSLDCELIVRDSVISASTTSTMVNGVLLPTLQKGAAL